MYCKYASVCCTPGEPTITTHNQFLQRLATGETWQYGLEEVDARHDAQQFQVHLLQLLCIGHTGQHLAPVLCGGLHVQDNTVTGAITTMKWRQLPMVKHSEESSTIVCYFCIIQIKYAVYFLTVTAKGKDQEQCIWAQCTKQCDFVE